jgi:uncharacterized RDD family membrane protein YckC
MTDVEGVLYANLGRRLGAWLLDSAILLCLLLTTALTIGFLRSLGVWAPTQGPPDEIWKALGFTPKLFAVLTFIISLGPLYFALFQSSSRQATFGKQLSTST